MVAGNICVVRSAVMPNSLPLNLYLESAYPLVDANVTPVNVTNNEIRIEFLAQSKKSVSVNSIR